MKYRQLLLSTIGATSLAMSGISAGEAYAGAPGYMPVPGGQYEHIGHIGPDGRVISHRQRRSVDAVRNRANGTLHDCVYRSYEYTCFQQDGHVYVVMNSAARPSGYPRPPDAVSPHHELTLVEFEMPLLSVSAAALAVSPAPRTRVGIPHAARYSPSTVAYRQATRSAARRAAGYLIFRAVPGVGIGLIAWELYKATR